jgi:IS30 family transposase
MQYHYNGTNKYQKITSPTLLGKLFAKNERTIRRELRRGMVLHDLGSEPFERWEYNAEYAQNDAESKSGGKGPDLKLGKDWALEKEISRLVREEDYSPYTIIQKFEEKGWPSITEKDLLLGGRRRKPREHRQAPATDQ